MTKDEEQKGQKIPMVTLPIRFPPEEIAIYSIMAREAQITVSSLLRNAARQTLKPWMDKIREERNGQ